MKQKTALFRLTCILVGLLTISTSSFSQNNFKVTGKVFDESGKPVQGANVSVKGMQITTATKADGSFEIIAPSGASVLVITSIGFANQEFSLTGKNEISITLAASVSVLEDVVVTGYGSRKKTDVTGAIVSIDRKKIEAVPVTNLTQALQGRIAGIEAVPNSFRPGAGSSIRIRGSRSLNASNDPLYVVDGIPVTYTIDDMNPGDIETVDVLKDASATAIYGVRGANGVVQITTKKGKAGKVTVEYNGSVSFDNLLRPLSAFNGPELADAWRQAYFADGLYTSTLTTAGTKFYFPSAVADARLFGINENQWSGVKNAYQYRYYNSVSDFATMKRAATTEEKTLMQNLGIAVLDSLDLYDPSKIKSYPWGEKFRQQGITNSHGINLTVGSEKIRSSFSGAYFNQKGIDPGQYYKRYSFANTNEFRPVKFLTIGNSVSYTNSNDNSTGIYGRAAFQIPFVEPYDADGKFLIFPNGDQIINLASPANDVGNVLNETKVSRVFGNVYAEVALIKGLKYKAVFGLDSRNTRNGFFNGTKTSTNPTAVSANAGYSVSSSLSWVYDNLLYYTFDINRQHTFNITLLHEMQGLNKTDTLAMFADNLIFESQKYYSLQKNTNALVTGNGNYAASQLLSYMGRIEYGFKNKYLLTLSNRYDNSSVLAEGNSGEFFPSAAFAWQLSNERFFKRQNLINYAKLRIGIGRVGNSSINPYQTNGPLATTLYSWNSNTPAIGLAPTTFPVPELTWEKTTTKNLGLELSLLKNRVNLTVDFYKSTTKDMLQRKSVTSTSGVSFLLVNLGEVSNKGIDLSLSSMNIDSKSGLRWTTDIIFSKNRESIVDIDGSGNSDQLNLWFLGQPIRVYYSWDASGIYQYSDTATGGYLKEYLWKKAGNSANIAFRPGKARMRDINGDTLINAADKMVLGSLNADWTGSITNTVSYKGFEFSCMIYIHKGGMYRVQRPTLVGRFNGFKVNYWTPTNPSNEYQQPTRTSDSPLYWEALTYRDATFARIRNISLTYRFPQSITSKLKATNLALYVNAVNPFLFHKQSTYDPETIPYFETFSATPAVPGPNSYSYRSIVLGLRLGL